jgi:hypothetical protein
MTDQPPESTRRATAGTSPGLDASFIRLPTVDDLEDIPGDAACWANRVCYECGRLNEAEHPKICEACGASFG